MSEVVAPERNASTGPQWWVQVRGQSYGPYSFEQLCRFVEEGRVRPNTFVSDKPESGWTEARRVGGLMQQQRSEVHTAPRVEAANVFVFAEIRSGAWMRFMAALEAMGALVELAPGLWLVRTRHSAGVIRNNLSQTLERGDKFVVMDATRDRFAWYNLGPEVDVRIGHVWNAPLRPEQK
ncbi:MAG: DUF4339 domain-containing protein [Hyphomonadaceae bacterium]|nr:DUF4339 domain-containing protein [Hyphomonadaceae bacterium]